LEYIQKKRNFAGKINKTGFIRMKREYSIAFLIIMVTGLAFVTLSGSVFSGYHFMDCSDYIRWKHDLSEMSWMKSLIKHINCEAGSRFRPAWHLNILLSTALLGDNMLLQGFRQIFLNIIAAFLIYLLGRRIRWTHNESLLFAGISLIGTQSAVFFQTLAIETPALVVLLLSWHFAISYFNDNEGFKKILQYAGFITFSLLAALMKENFILALPASYVFYCMQYNEKYHTGFYKTIIHTLKTGLFLLLAIIVCLWAIFRFVGDSDAGYAGVTLSTGILAYFKSAVYLYVLSGCILALGGFFHLYRNKKIFREESLFPVLLFMAITVPQIIIYGKSNIIDRYLIPAITGCAYFSIYIYRELRKQDKSVNGLLWKNISLVSGIIITAFCGMIVFYKPLQEETVRYAVRLQGEVVQTITSISSLQYLTISLSIIGITGMIIGCVLLIWGIWRKKYSIHHLSKLYISGLLLIFFMNAGLAFASCRRYAMRGFAIESFLKTITDHSRAGDAILAAGDPRMDMEALASGFPVYLRDRNRTNLFFYPVAGHSQGEELVSGILRDSYDNRDINAIKDKETVQIVAIFPGMETSFVNGNDWFNVNSFDRYEFTGNYVVYVRK
jgi:hypothetical protein